MTDVARKTDVEALVATVRTSLDRSRSYDPHPTHHRQARAALAALHSLLLRAEEERDYFDANLRDYARKLSAAEEERDRLQHVIDCADTPLMRDVMRERDACAELLRWQPHTERGLVNLHPQHRAAVERARALIAEEP